MSRYRKEDAVILSLLSCATVTAGVVGYVIYWWVV